MRSSWQSHKETLFFSPHERKGALMYFPSIRYRTARWALHFLILLSLIALLAPLLANDRPLYCRYKGQHLFPAFSFRNSAPLSSPDKNGQVLINYHMGNGWKLLEYETVIWPLCTYSPETSDLNNAQLTGPLTLQVFKKMNGDFIKMPPKFRHWLGTTRSGRDVLSGLIHGSRISLLVGLLSMFLASLLGFILGALSGYYGNTYYRVSWIKLCCLLLGLLLAVFYGWQIRRYDLAAAFHEGGFSVLTSLGTSLLLSALVYFIFLKLGNFLEKWFQLRLRVQVPVDSLISRLIEIINSLPVFLLILAISAIARPSFVNLVIILCLLCWTQLARLVRAEFMKIRELDYVQAAQALGLREYSIILRHILPNALAPALVQIAFGVASAILAESALSFLGVGVPPDVVTWGSLLSEARENIRAWWMIVFPGLAIFVTVTAYNILGESIRIGLDPRLTTHHE